MKKFISIYLNPVKAYPIIVFWGAFLLFLVQPLISKNILPWFGGSPSVWTVALLFFQTFLLAGYAYAHFLSYFKIKNQKLLYLIPLFLALLLLPITPSSQWQASNGLSPTLHVLLLLVATVGLPYLVLAAASPLLQSWFSRISSETSTYRLYAWSNAGSLLGLLIYPILVEPLFTLTQQTILWSGMFICFALAVFFLTYKQKISFKNKITEAIQDFAPKPKISQKIFWLFLPALATLLLVATTNYITQDIAAVPFLWVLPLSLYLLSFIIVFNGSKFYTVKFFQNIFIAISILGIIMITKCSGLPIILLLINSLVLLFVYCLVCHAELYALKPHPRYLTSFYLLVSLGGALGGAFVAIIAPIIFPLYYEFHLGVGLTFLVITLIWFKNKLWLTQIKSLAFKKIMLVLLILIILGSLSVDIKKTLTEPTRLTRDFYGVLRLFKWPSQTRLYHGRVLHGSQYTDEQTKCLPTAYYGQTSGIGQAVKAYGKDKDIRLGVVGLGAGCVASYADYVKFYELNPAVFDSAKNDFSYLKDCTKQYDVLIGDGRLLLEKESPQNFDILVLDAFNSDAIPIHLLTVEAFETYLKHLKEKGLIVIHISNTYINLQPVVAGLANNFNLDLVITMNEADIQTSTDASTWAILSQDNDLIAQIKNDQPETNKIIEVNKAVLWTDKYSNLFTVLRFD